MLNQNLPSQNNSATQSNSLSTSIKIVGATVASIAVLLGLYRLSKQKGPIVIGREGLETSHTTELAGDQLKTSHETVAQARYAVADGKGSKVIAKAENGGYADASYAKATNGGVVVAPALTSKPSR